MGTVNYSELRVVSALPNGRWLPTEGAEQLRALNGAKIVAIGSTGDEANIEGGGLLLDYVPMGSTQVWRLVLAFTELGMWIEYHAPLPTRVDLPD